TLRRKLEVLRRRLDRRRRLHALARPQVGEASRTEGTGASRRAPGRPRRRRGHREAEGRDAARPFLIPRTVVRSAGGGRGHGRIEPTEDAAYQASAGYLVLEDRPPQGAVDVPARCLLR